MKYFLLCDSSVNFMVFNVPVNVNGCRKTKCLLCYRAQRKKEFIMKISVFERLEATLFIDKYFIDSILPFFLMFDLCGFYCSQVYVQVFFFNTEPRRIYIAGE